MSEKVIFHVDANSAATNAVGMRKHTVNSTYQKIMPQPSTAIDGKLRKLSTAATLINANDSTPNFLLEAALFFESVILSFLQTIHVVIVVDHLYPMGIVFESGEFAVEFLQDMHVSQNRI